MVLDAFSRRVIGWALGRTLEAELAVAALRMALLERQPAPGLVHHSDRGVQYASHDYTELLKQHQATISMSRKGNPYDNAACESFMKTLKYEEVYRNEYRDFDDARASIGEFLERVYNQKRLHSALGYVPPAEFENGAASMSRHRRSHVSSTGALPLRPRDLTQLRQNGCLATGRLDAAPAIPAAESTLGSHPCVALSSAQVFPEWINRNLAVQCFCSERR